MYQRLRLTTKNNRSTGREKSFLENLSAPILLLVVRVIRRWNQTGQKHAGEPDIKGMFSSHTMILWLLVLVTYLDLARRLSRCSLPITSRQLSSAIFLTLSLAALRFKIAFTAADAPELFIGLPRFIKDSVGNTSLVAHCKLLFLGTGAIAGVLIFARAYHKLSRKKDDTGKLNGTQT